MDDSMIEFLEEEVMEIRIALQRIAAALEALNSKGLGVGIIPN